MPTCIFLEFNLVKLTLGLRDASVARETDVVLSNPGTELTSTLLFFDTLEFQDSFNRRLVKIRAETLKLAVCSSDFNNVLIFPLLYLFVSVIKNKLVDIVVCCIL